MRKVDIFKKLSFSSILILKTIFSFGTFSGVFFHFITENLIFDSQRRKDLGESPQIYQLF